MHPTSDESVECVPGSLGSGKDRKDTEFSIDFISLTCDTYNKSSAFVTLTDLSIQAKIKITINLVLK